MSAQVTPDCRGQRTGWGSTRMGREMPMRVIICFEKRPSVRNAPI